MNIKAVSIEYLPSRLFVICVGVLAIFMGKVAAQAGNTLWAFAFVGLGVVSICLGIYL